MLIDVIIIFLIVTGFLLLNGYLSRMSAAPKERAIGAGIIGLIINAIVNGFLNWFTDKKKQDMEAENAALQEALHTVEDSHNQEDQAEDAANEAANNTPSVADPDGGINFTGFNSRDKRV